MIRSCLLTLAKFLIQATLITLITVGLLEVLVVLSFRFPGASPIPTPMLQQLHALFARNTIQVMPECARYDETLTYTLRPGRCTFSNPEFRNIYTINSLGLRDDERSLDQPEVVVLGDSVAMGWGVDQDDAFPKVFERLTGLRTLNAGISSYGTARELMLLERIDRRALTHVVIQYHRNDLPENRAFISGHWRTLTREQYEQTKADHERTLRYFPGKYSVNIVVLLRNALLGQTGAPDDASRDEEAAVFLRVLEESPVDLTPFDVTVLSLDSEFIAAAARLAATSASEFLQRLRFLDVGSVADLPGAFYVLDEHPTRAGHEAIAMMLAAVATADGRVPPPSAKSTSSGEATR